MFVGGVEWQVKSRHPYFWCCLKKSEVENDTANANTRISRTSWKIISFFLNTKNINSSLKLTAL